MYLIEKFKMDAPVKPPRILGGYSKKIEKSEKFSQKNLDINPTTLIIIVIGSVIFPNKLPTSSIK